MKVRPRQGQDEVKMSFTFSNILYVPFITKTSIVLSAGAKIGGICAESLI